MRRQPLCGSMPADGLSPIDSNYTTTDMTIYGLEIGIRRIKIPGLGITGLISAIWLRRVLRARSINSAPIPKRTSQERHPLGKYALSCKEANNG